MVNSAQSLGSDKFDEMKKIYALVSTLPADPIFREFASSYLQANSTRSLQDCAPDEFAEFIKERFEFFKDALHKNGDMRIFVAPHSVGGITSVRVLEYVVPDAQYLVMTFSEVFKELGLRITKMLHPIMTVETAESGEITSVRKPEPGTRLISATYIELEGADDDQTADHLFSLIQSHLAAIQSSEAGRNAINDTLSQVKQDIIPLKIELPEPKDEWINLIDWLRGENFSFFGYVALAHHDSKTTQVPGSGIGILSDSYAKHDRNNTLEILKAHSWRSRHSETPFVFDTIQAAAPIQRFENLMRLSFRVPQNSGVIEHNFVGLLKRSSLLAKNLETPIIHLKMKHIFESKNMLPGSYDYNEVIRIFTSIPKFELF
ncbi:hypothetical protein EBR96_03920 [bacterium]|nr:hypothetical protein [bacterium]